MSQEHFQVLGFLPSGLPVLCFDKLINRSKLAGCIILKDVAENGEGKTKWMGPKPHCQ